MNWFSFLGYVVAAVFSPGPNNITSMSNAVRYGFLGSLKYRCGIFCGFFTVQVLAALFSALLLDLIPAIQPYMLAVGAAYILWMAWKTFTSKPSAESPADARDNTFLSGLLLQFVNVKVIVFAVTTMSVYAVPHSTKPLFLVGFGLMMACFSFASINSWAAFGAIFSRILRRHERIVNCVMGALLAYCAVSLYL